MLLLLFYVSLVRCDFYCYNHDIRFDTPDDCECKLSIVESCQAFKKQDNNYVTLRISNYDAAAVSSKFNVPNLSQMTQQTKNVGLLLEVLKLKRITNLINYLEKQKVTLTNLEIRKMTNLKIEDVELLIKKFQNSLISILLVDVFDSKLNAEFNFAQFSLPNLAALDFRHITGTRFKLGGSFYSKSLYYTVQIKIHKYI